MDPTKERIYLNALNMVLGVTMTVVILTYSFQNFLLNMIFIICITAVATMSAKIMYITRELHGDAKKADEKKEKTIPQ